MSIVSTWENFDPSNGDLLYLVKQTHYWKQCKLCRKNKNSCPLNLQSWLRKLIYSALVQECQYIKSSFKNSTSIHLSQNQMEVGSQWTVLGVFSVFVIEILNFLYFHIPLKKPSILPQSPWQVNLSHHLKHIWQKIKFLCRGKISKLTGPEEINLKNNFLIDLHDLCWKHFHWKYTDIFLRTLLMISQHQLR